MDLVIFEAESTREIELEATDVVRLKIFENDQVPILDLSSSNPDEIVFTVGKGECVIYLTEEQVGRLGVGAFDAEISVWVELEGKLKSAGSGVLFVHPTQLGEVGGEESSQSQQSSSSSSSVSGSSISDSSSF